MQIDLAAASTAAVRATRRSMRVPLSNGSIHRPARGTPQGDSCGLRPVDASFSAANSPSFSERAMLGFRVLPAPPRLDERIVRRFAGWPSATLADAMGRFNFMDEGIRARTG